MNFLFLIWIELMLLNPADEVRDDDLLSIIWLTASNLSARPIMVFNKSFYSLFWRMNLFCLSSFNPLRNLSMTMILLLGVVSSGNAILCCREKLKNNLPLLFKHTHMDGCGFNLEGRSSSSDKWIWTPRRELANIISTYLLFFVTTPLHCLKEDES